MKWLDVHDRIHEHMVRIHDEPVVKCKARKATTCVFSGKPISPGDWVYRPLSNSDVRSVRWLASVVEEAERELNAKITAKRNEFKGE